MRETSPASSRTVRIILSTEQQEVILPQFQQYASEQLGISPQEAGSVVIQSLARLTPDMTLSQATLLKVIAEEIRAYWVDPAGYEARYNSNTYIVEALGSGASSNLGAFSPDMIELHAPTVVPSRATPQSVWWEFSQGIDGYNVAERLGWRDLKDLAEAIRRNYRHTGQWHGSLLDLRLTLFWIGRAIRHSGQAIEELSEEHVNEVATLLGAISALTRTPN